LIRGEATGTRTSTRYGGAAASTDFVIQYLLDERKRKARREPQGSKAGAAISVEIGRARDVLICSKTTLSHMKHWDLALSTRLAHTVTFGVVQRASVVPWPVSYLGL